MLSACCSLCLVEKLQINVNFSSNNNTTITVIFSRFEKKIINLFGGKMFACEGAV